MKFKRRKKMVIRKKRRNRRIICMVVAIAVISAGGGWLITASDWFSIEEVRLLGSDDLPVDSLRTVAAGCIGENLLTLSISDLEKKFKNFPIIRDVEFRRRFFHRLDCYFRERRPVALLAGEKFMELDSEGVIIGGEERSSNLDLPVITGVTLRDGENDDREKLSHALEVLSLLKNFGFCPSRQLSEIHVKEGNVVLIWMETGTRVYLGEGNFDSKIRKFRAIYGELNRDSRFPGFIDLRFDQQVIVRG